MSTWRPRLGLEMDRARFPDHSLREQELSARLRWFLALRWLWAGGAGLVAAFAASPWAPQGLTPWPFLGIALALGLANAAFQVLTPAPPSPARARALVIAQTLTDCAALAVASHVLGAMAGLMLPLYLTEIALVTLLCRRVVGLLLTLLALAFALAPRVLETLGLWAPATLHGGPLSGAWPLEMAGMALGFLYFWYVIGEITASLRHHEDRLAQACDRLALLDREKTRAMLHSAHELKSPLAAIQTQVYNLLGGYYGELPPKAQAVVERIGARTQGLMTRVQEIIHLSNLRTLARPEADREPLDLVDLLDEEVAAIREQASARSIEVAFGARRDPPLWVCGSRGQLHTLFSNLLQNAVNYSHDGGRVELGLEVHPNRVAVKIRDRGIGIAPEQQKEIFAEHFRTPEAAAHNPEGTGLGLALVKEIARIHHALLRVESRPGEGSTFRVTFHRIHSPGAGETGNSSLENRSVISGDLTRKGDGEDHPS